MDVLALSGLMIQSNHRSYFSPSPHSTLWQLTSQQTRQVHILEPGCGQDNKRQVQNSWKGPGLGEPAFLQNHQRTKQVTLTAFYLNSGLFLISCRSENYSSDPLERFVYLFPSSLSLPEWGWVSRTLHLLPRCLLF